MSSPFSLFKWEAVFTDWKIFGGGLLVTVKVGILALIVAIIIGIVVGVLSTSKLKFFKAIGRVYVELIQNTPLVIQVFILFNALPYLGIVLNVVSIGVLALGVYHGAYVAEVIRAGIGSVSKGQMEAGLSQGFTFTECMRYIILPQAFKIVLPPLANQGVALLKNTSVLAMIAGGDLMYSSDSWSSSNMYYGPAYLTTGLLYFMLCFPLATLAKKLEEKKSFGNKGKESESEEKILGEKAEGVI
ncbi:amino acid ABC transporter permease [Clostridium vincentii]|uniref:Putative glutamine ABC transporter permease protein GlnM n=1 Tax=Clostridium vincentii TaxID=52704 RepID=A0A2T0BJQ3_9CLOT|nr:amino acid ABC transporter permease [Clostridium vincentii]PRR84101.1 putative glutamine ABC transporter permease protein GlnM [Clostridium vincentii]